MGFSDRGLSDRGLSDRGLGDRGLSDRGLSALIAMFQARGLINVMISLV